MEQEAERVGIMRMAEKYAEYWGKKEVQDELLAVFGHKQAGKSVMVDLLAGK